MDDDVVRSLSFTDGNGNAIFRPTPVAINAITPIIMKMEDLLQRLLWTSVVLDCSLGMTKGSPSLGMTKGSPFLSAGDFFFVSSNKWFSCFRLVWVCSSSGWSVEECSLESTQGSPFQPKSWYSDDWCWCLIQSGFDMMIDWSGLVVITFPRSDPINWMTKLPRVRESFPGYFRILLYTKETFVHYFPIVVLGIAFPTMFRFNNQHNSWQKMEIIK